MTPVLFAFLFLGSALASPLGWETFMLEERTSATQYYTNVSMSPQKVSFGSVTPEDAVQGAMSCACPPGTETCDTATSQKCLTVQTQIYKDATQPPENAELVFTPGTTVYHADTAALFVQALASVAGSAKSCESKTWVNAGQTRSGEDGQHTATFCGLSQEIVISRFNVLTGAPVDSMSFSVTMELEPFISFSWCDITGILGAIAGVFSGGAALAAAFGVGNLVCGDATKGAGGS